jgi:hypothetical protein
MVTYRAVLLAVLVAALFSATAASAAGPTRASWARAANAICTGENAQVRELPKVTSATFLSDLKSIAKYATATVDQLAAIPRPANEAKSIASLIAKGKTMNRLVLRQAIPAAQSGNAALTNSTMGKVGSLGDQSNALARKLGAARCAANPTPSGNSLAA